MMDYHVIDFQNVQYDQPKRYQILQEVPEPQESFHCVDCRFHENLLFRLKIIRTQ